MVLVLIFLKQTTYLQNDFDPHKTAPVEKVSSQFWCWTNTIESFIFLLVSIMKIKALPADNTV